MSVVNRVANRPAETTTGLGAAVVAVLVATLHLSTPLATVLVVVVGALPGLVTTVVSTTRSTASGLLLVSLTPAVRELAERALQSGMRESSSTAQAAALQGVTDALSSWTAVLAAESGATASAKKAAATS